jgi:hypothetical protein
MMDEKTVDNAIETAKSGSQALEHLTDLFNKLAGPLASELGQMMGDKARVYRTQNWLRCERRIAKMLLEAKAEPRAIPSRLFLPALEASSLEDDADLQELWAALIANMATHDMETPSAYITFLKELSRCEALALQDLFDTTAHKYRLPADTLPFMTPVGNAAFTEGDLFEALGPLITFETEERFSNKDYKPSGSIVEVAEYGVLRAKMSIANLLRLQILERTVPKDELPKHQIRADEPCYCFTALGWMFVTSCQPPGKIKRFRF